MKIRDLSRPDLLCYIRNYPNQTDRRTDIVLLNIIELKQIWFFSTIFQPHDHKKKVAKFYWATPELVNKAIDVSLKAKADWERVPIDEKIDMFRKVSDDMAGKYRAQLNATTMLGQAKTIIQVSQKSIF